ncbi:MAG: response regulator [Gemmatimonadetes bacterium]|nr:response regulator [Gemmatimonadota bacterium]
MPSTNVRAPHTVLVVDDDPEDREFTQRALEQLGPRVDCKFASDGDAAIRFLEAHADADLGRPSVVLLDLNMPRVDGRGVLRYLREREDLRDISLIVLTTAEDRVEATRCYGLGADAFVTKPSDPRVYLDWVGRAVRFALGPDPEEVSA